MMDLTYLPAGLNGVVSLAIIFVCICRASKIDGRVLRRVQASYVLLVMGAAANGASPWMFAMPGWPSVAFSGAVLWMLAADGFQWRDGPPAAATSPAPLEPMR